MEFFTIHDSTLNVSFTGCSAPLRKYFSSSIQCKNHPLSKNEPGSVETGRKDDCEALYPVAKHMISLEHGSNISTTNFPKFFPMICGASCGKTHQLTRNSLEKIRKVCDQETTSMFQRRHVYSYRIPQFSGIFSASSSRFRWAKGSAWDI